VRTATLRDLNNNSSALARAAQAGETVVITDRGTPIADLIPHRGLPRGVGRDAFLAMVDQLRRLTLTSDTAEKQRAELDELVDPDVVDPYDRFR
jgi:prevent-host-death family protein